MLGETTATAQVIYVPLRCRAVQQTCIRSTQFRQLQAISVSMADLEL
jgi:hypothetical protein